MRLYFQLPEFDAQLMRTCSYIYSQGADLGECLTTAHHIKEGDRNSWLKEWAQTAERIYEQAKESRRQGQIISARQDLLRASNYFRTATFFHYDTLQDPTLIETFDRQTSTFSEAVPLFDSIGEAIAIPFENGTMPGYFLTPDALQIARPVIIVNQGYDATMQESYFFLAQSALARGYNVLIFDGPGQGSMLIHEHIYMRHNWETVISPIVDYLCSRQDVDKESIALVGVSWGGYLAPRAAAFEPRLAALVALPGIFSPIDILRDKMPGVKEYLATGDCKLLESTLEQVTQVPMMDFRFRSKMAIHGKESFVEWIDDLKQYTLVNIADKIECPTLVMDSENEPLSGGQAKPLYEALTCPKDYLFLSDAEGAGEHCGSGALSLVQQKIFDWLGTKVLSKSTYIT